MAEILRGDVVAAALRARVAADVARLKTEQGVIPGLAVVLVGQDPPSEVYVRRKLLAAREVGILSFEHRLDENVEETALLALVAALNADPAVHGILVQLPLPAHIRAGAVLDAVDPGKDVDGFHPVNVGRLSTGGLGLVPCTPLGVMLLLDEVIGDFRGLNAIVIGKSNIVGKPVGLLLLERECTVTITHIHTRGLPEIVRGADIVVAAAGAPRLVRGHWIKPGAVVIDVGITRVMDEGGRARLVGDVATDEAGHAAVITPVPNGVGPMTVACLLANTVKAALARA